MLVLRAEGKSGQGVESGPGGPLSRMGGESYVQGAGCMSAEEKSGQGVESGPGGPLSRLEGCTGMEV